VPSALILMAVISVLRLPKTSITVPVRDAGSRPLLASVLQEGWKGAIIRAGLAAISGNGEYHAIFVGISCRSRRSVRFGRWGVSSAAHADSGTIWIEELKGGWFIGGSAGSGTLIFHGRRYPLSIGGLSAGLVFGGSVTRLYGYVSNIRSPWDVAGVYGGAGAGAALVVGARAIMLRNEKGAVLRLSGRQIGLIANADLSGLAIGLR
jgi:hypothetical protein